MTAPKPSNSRLTGVLRLRVDAPFQARHLALVVFACGAMLLGALQLLRGTGADPDRLEAKNERWRAPRVASADGGVEDDARKRPPTPDPVRDAVVPTASPFSTWSICNGSPGEPHECRRLDSLIGNGPGEEP